MPEDEKVEGTGERPEGEKPAAKPSAAGPTLEKLRELESKYQSREAAANKRASQAERELDQVKAERDAARAEAEEAKLYGDDEEAKAASRALRQKQGDLDRQKREFEEWRTSEQTKTQATQKALAAYALMTKYPGLPEEELADCATAMEMENKAMRWALDHKPKEEKKAPPPESGEQRLGRKSVASMSSAEFAKDWEERKRAALKKASR